MNESIILQIYYGLREELNIGKPSAKYNELRDELLICEETLRKGLSETPELLALYDKIETLIADMDLENIDGIFVSAFRLGAQIALAAIAP